MDKIGSGRKGVMETIKRAWQLDGLEVNGVAMIAGYILFAALLYLTYARVF